MTRSARRAGGFTLTEVLVIIGIIVVLAALALPMSLRAWRQASKTRTLSDLNAIAIALNAYRQDFGDYPRIGKNPLTNEGMDTGAAVLGKALVGPYGDGFLPNSAAPDTSDPPALASLDENEIKSGQAVRDSGGRVALVDAPGTNPSDPLKWVAFNVNDGADGPGFRTRPVIPPQPPQGKVWGPYVQMDQFRVHGVFFHDRDGSPILYFPAAPGNPNIRENINTPAGVRAGYVDRSAFSKYDARDNITLFRRDGEGNDTNALRAIRAMLGDADVNGIINSGETPASEAAFILWTPGPDGLFGPIRPTPLPATWPGSQDVARCDDIASFHQ